MVRRIHDSWRWRLVGVCALLGTFTDRPVAQQRPDAKALLSGAQIEAQDGDTVVVQGDARVRIVRRRSAHMRVVFDGEQRSLILIVGNPPSNGSAPDSGVAETLTFREIGGDWPLPQRWEGDASIEDYAIAGDGRPHGFGFRSPLGTVQLFTSPDDRPLFTDPSAAAVLSYRGSSRSRASGLSFNEAEQGDKASGIVGVTGGVVGGVPGGIVPADRGTPRKIHDVAPVLPEAARRTGIHGVVILELTIGVDGAVAAARVLRSIPQLDDAALDCARQWRYEPTLLDGRAVPRNITVAVTFP